MTSGAHPSLLPFLVLPSYHGRLCLLSLAAVSIKADVCSPARSPLPSAVFNKKLECAPSHLMLSNNTDLSTSPLLFRRSRVRRDPPASNHANSRLHPSLLAVPGHHVPSSSSASLTATLLHTPTASQSGLYIHDIKTDTVTRRLRNI